MARSIESGGIQEAPYIIYKTVTALDMISEADKTILRAYFSVGEIALIKVDDGPPSKIQFYHYEEREGSWDFHIWIDPCKGADGVSGENGITPHIDPRTKHWMIGTTDTGVLAEGRGGSGGTAIVKQIKTLQKLQDVDAVYFVCAVYEGEILKNYQVNRYYLNKADRATNLQTKPTSIGVIKKLQYN